MESSVPGIDDHKNQSINALWKAEYAVHSEASNVQQCLIFCIKINKHIYLVSMQICFNV